MRVLFAITLLLTAGLCAQAQHDSNELTVQLKKLIGQFQGDMGLFVIDLKSGETIAINADTVYPTASMVKIPILVGVMHKIVDGELSWHQQLTYTDSLFYNEGDDMLASFKSGEEIDLAKVVSLMMSFSDNAASLWLQGLAGGGVLINAQMDALGLKHTRVNSRTEGRRGHWQTYGWGQTTPREIAGLMKLVVDNKIISRTVSERMLRMMGRQYWDEYAHAEIPPDVFVASKGGAVDASRGEVLYVHGPHPYIFAICSKNNKDTSWTNDNEAWVVTRKISGLLWRHFNPNSTWVPADPLP